MKELLQSRIMPALALLLVGAAALPPLARARFQPTSGFDLFSAQQEVQAGQQAAAEVNKQMPVLPDSDPVVRYVQQLGARLVAHAPGQKWPYNFHVVAEKDINAFALPGGPVYVNLGTIQAAETESQLAGVMAHEISHIVQRHSTRAATKQMEAQLPLALLGGFLGNSLGGQLAQLGISFGVNSYFLKNSRSAEQQADLLGTDIMYDTGYDPHSLPQFFEIIKQKYPSRAPQFLSDHPDPGNRIVYVSKEIATLPPRQFIEDSPEFQQIKKRALGMKTYTAQQIQQGVASGGGAAATPASGGIRPSTSFTRFQHSAYTIGYPSDWQVMGDQNSSVTIAPQSALSRNAVAYGVIISGFRPENPNSLDAATHELIAQLQQANPGLREIGHDSDMKVNGVAAKSVDLIGTSPVTNSQGKPEPERDWLVVLPLSNQQQVLYAVFISPDPNYSQLRPTFENMLRTLKLR